MQHGSSRFADGELVEDAVSRSRRNEDSDRVQSGAVDLNAGPHGRRRLVHVLVDKIRPDPRNPKRHVQSQVRAIARSIAGHGFNAPILVDKSGQIIAGHGRYEAAKLLRLTQVPVIYLDHLSATQARTYMLA